MSGGDFLRGVGGDVVCHQERQHFKETFPAKIPHLVKVQVRKYGSVQVYKFANVKV